MRKKRKPAGAPVPMHPAVVEGYRSLVPADQLIIDAMIAVLVGKDQEIHRLNTQVMSYLTDGTEDSK